MEQGIGIAISLAAIIAMCVYQIRVLKRLKKDTEKYCRMEF